MINAAKRGASEEPASSISIEQVWRWHVTEFRAPTGEPWAPAINVYRLPDRMEVCIELAGMEPGQIDLRVEPGKLTVRGQRTPPQPKLEAGQNMQILTMEIGHGPFGRSVAIPTNVDLSAVGTQYRQGMLRVILPLR